MKVMRFLQTTTARVMKYSSLGFLAEVNSGQPPPRLIPYSLIHLYKAFTARSIAGLVGDIGLLTKAGLPYLAEVFLDFENRSNSRYRPAYRNIPFPNKPSASDPLYADELERVWDDLSLASGIVTDP